MGSFANIDVLSAADCLVTSLTKSFSGYADVIAGSVVLNPLAPSYAALKPLLASLHHNELFAGDATVLLSNSADYLARTPVLNSNAAALAAVLARHAADDPNTPIRAVLYPTTSDTRANYVSNSYSSPPKHKQIADDQKSRMPIAGPRPPTSRARATAVSYPSTSTRSAPLSPSTTPLPCTAARTSAHTGRSPCP